MGGVVNLAGQEVETEESRRRKVIAAFEAERKQFMEEGMPYLSMLIDDLLVSQSYCNRIGAYETHRILSRMGVRLAWLRAGVAQALKTETDIVLSGVSVFELWNDDRVKEVSSNSDILSLHQQLTRIGMQLVNLSNIPLVRGDIVLAVARIEEAKEVSLIEFQEMTQGKFLVKLQKHDSDGKEESAVHAQGGE